MAQPGRVGAVNFQGVKKIPGTQRRPLFLEGQASQKKAEIPTKTRVIFGFQVPYRELTYPPKMAF